MLKRLSVWTNVWLSGAEGVNNDPPPPRAGITVTESPEVSASDVYSICHGALLGTMVGRAVLKLCGAMINVVVLADLLPTTTFTPTPLVRLFVLLLILTPLTFAVVALTVVVFTLAEFILLLETL